MEHSFETLLGYNTECSRALLMAIEQEDGVEVSSQNLGIGHCKFIYHPSTIRTKDGVKKKSESVRQ